MERLQKSGRAVMCFMIHESKQHYLVNLIAVHQSSRNGDHHPLFSCWSCTRSRSVDWRSWLMPTYVYNICNSKVLLQTGFSVVLWSQYGPINCVTLGKKKKEIKWIGEEELCSEKQCLHKGYRGQGSSTTASSLIQCTTPVYIPQEILAKFRQHIDMGLMYGKLQHHMLKW